MLGRDEMLNRWDGPPEILQMLELWGWNVDRIVQIPTDGVFFPSFPWSRCETKKQRWHQNVSFPEALEPFDYLSKLCADQVFVSILLQAYNISQPLLGMLSHSWSCGGCGVAVASNRYLKCSEGGDRIHVWHLEDFPRHQWVPRASSVQPKPQCSQVITSKGRWCFQHTFTLKLETIWKRSMSDLDELSADIPLQPQAAHEQFEPSSSARDLSPHWQQGWAVSLVIQIFDGVRKCAFRGGWAQRYWGALHCLCAQKWDGANGAACGQRCSWSRSNVGWNGSIKTLESVHTYVL